MFLKWLVSHSQKYVLILKTPISNRIFQWNFEKFITNIENILSWNYGCVVCFYKNDVDDMQFKNDGKLNI